MIPLKYRTPLFLAMIAAGLAGNFCHFSLFLDIRFLFGSVFSLLALQCFGLGWGILAAAIISLCDALLWNQPIIGMVLTAEVAAVGWLLFRHRIEMVPADTLFWFFAGMPFIFLFYHFFLPVSVSNTTIVMVQEAINGIANALVSRLMFTGIMLYTRSQPTSFKNLLCNLLSFFLLFPTLNILAVENKANFDQAIATIPADMTRRSETVHHFLQTWVDNRKLTILHLAKLAASHPPQQLQPGLELALKTDSNNFLQIGLLNKEGTLTALYPFAHENGQSPIGKNFTNHPSIPRFRQNLTPMLSEVIAGGTSAAEPFVAILAPVLVNGKYSGYITGILSTEEIRDYLDRTLSPNAVFYTVVDKNGNVILSNRLDQTVTKPFTREQGSIINLTDHISQWTPVKPGKTTSSEGSSRSSFITETGLGDMEEWKLILEMPMAPIQEKLYTSYTKKLTLLLLVLVCALVLAELFSRRLNAAFTQLCLVSRDLPARLGRKQDIDWPESTLEETRQLIENFKDLAEALSLKFNETNDLNAALETEIQERTARLKDSEAQYRSILEASPDGITITDMSGRILMASPVGETMFGYGGENPVAGHLITEFIAAEERERALANIRFLNHIPGPREYRGLRLNGTHFDIEVNRDFIHGDDGQPVAIVFVVRDITDRKQIEEENAVLEAQNRQFQKNESLTRMAGAIAHTFNNLLTGVMGNLDIALEDLNPNSPPTRYLNQAMQAAHKAAEVSGLMLTYLGQTVGEQKWCDLSEICQQRLRQLEAEVDDAITVLTDLPSPGPTVKANTGQIQRILANLFINSVESLKNRKGTISITIKRMPAAVIPSAYPIGWLPTEPFYACLDIADEGVGIPAEDIDKLFDPFFSTKFTGRGLGLPVVLGILKSHGGAIAVESVPEYGSHFRVFLPCK